jgi:hypothetical protein
LKLFIDIARGKEALKCDDIKIDVGKFDGVVVAGPVWDHTCAQPLATWAERGYLLKSKKTFFLSISKSSEPGKFYQSIFH